MLRKKRFTNSFRLQGQKAKSEIRDRIDKVSLRYEKLVILICSDASQIQDGLGTNECIALVEFNGFTAGLDCNIIAYFIGPEPEALSKWVMSLIIQNRVVEELLPDETLWELFLRRAGMNAFAAQALVTFFKAPEGIDMTSPSKTGMHGLSWFVEMPRLERILRFKHICGAKVLERVSDAIDTKWGS